VPSIRVERALAKAPDTRTVMVEVGALSTVEAALHAHFAAPRTPLLADESTD
jgi:hypothetical protein